MFEFYGPLKLIHFDFVKLLDPLNIRVFHFIKHIAIEVDFIDGIFKLIFEIVVLNLLTNSLEFINDSIRRFEIISLAN